MTSWESRLERVRDAIEGWRGRLLAPDEIAPSSSLAADDRVYPALPCSQLARWGLSVGVEHLDATLRLLKAQVAAGGPILPLANFTILRAGLVGSCQAVTLLAARSREDRTTVGLQIAHEELRQELNFREKTLAHAGLVEAARQAAESRDFLVRLRVRKADVAHLLRARGAELKLRDTTMIERAAGLVHTSGTDSELMRLAVQMGWALGSAAAHGRLLMSMQRAGSFRDETGGTMLFGATYEEIAIEIASVSLVLSQGWRYWDLRRD